MGEELEKINLPSLLIMMVVPRRMMLPANAKRLVAYRSAPDKLSRFSKRSRRPTLRFMNK